MLFVVVMLLLFLCCCLVKIKHKLCSLFLFYFDKYKSCLYVNIILIPKYYEKITLKKYVTVVVFSLVVCKNVKTKVEIITK